MSSGGLVSENTDERRSREEDAARRPASAAREGLPTFMETLQFRMDGRTVYEGVPAIVVSFTPKPECET